MHDELLRSIHLAFPDDGVPPRPVTGHRCFECDEVDALLGGRTWTDVVDNFPDYCFDAFPLLTPVAQIYYLPAYMIIALTTDWDIPGISIESALSDGRLRPEAYLAMQQRVIWAWLQAWWRLYHEGEEADPKLFSAWGGQRSSDTI